MKMQYRPDQEPLQEHLRVTCTTGWKVTPGKPPQASHQNLSAISCDDGHEFWMRPASRSANSKPRPRRRAAEQQDWDAASDT